MALTITSLKQSFWDLIVGNAAILAALGNGSASVVLRQRLRAPHPVAPFVVIAYGGVTGAREDVRTLFPTIWLYDDPLQEWTRITALATIIEGVLAPDAIAYCDTRYAGGVGEEITDASLARPALSLRYQIKGRF